MTVVANNLNARPVPWYKQGWPWFLITFPATAVVAGLITFYIAYVSFDGMVVDDYYKEGRTIDVTVARVVKAAELGLVAAVTLKSEELSVVLTSSAGATLPPTLVAIIERPTSDDFDQTVLLIGRNGVYTAEIETLTIGRWNVHLEDESRTWRLKGTANLPAETEFRIDPYGS